MNLRNYRHSTIECIEGKYNDLSEKLGWYWYNHPWSKNGQQYLIKELADHLKRIIMEER
jgi:hypothetical protein